MSLRSFKFAIRGIISAVLYGKNLRIMLVFFSVVIAASIFFDLSGLEWAVILVCSAGVISTEMINTAIETVINMITSEYKPLAKIAKDIAAGAVLVFSIVSAAVGLIIFVPRILQLIDNI
ncbi:MAG: diacylglycerol kinase family protein [Christensenellales bacterium]